MGQFWRSENRLLPQPFGWQICFLDNTTPDQTRSGSWMESPIHNSSQETICWFSIFSRRWWVLFSTPDWSRTDRQEQDHFGSFANNGLNVLLMVAPTNFHGTCGIRLCRPLFLKKFAAIPPGFRTVSPSARTWPRLANSKPSTHVSGHISGVLKHHARSRYVPFPFTARRG